MAKTTVIIAGAIVLISFGVLAYLSQARPSASSASSDEKKAVQRVVTDFGAVMKNVSLLQDAEMLAPVLAKEYGPFITPELLLQWQADPSVALGRNVSSPWPDRIEIVETQNTDDGYRVSGNVIEVTSQSNNPAAVYPVVLALRKQGDEWRIAKVEKGAYSELPQTVVKEGIGECLPHTNTTGPQTMECAYGLAVSESDAHYALDLQALPNGPVDFKMNVRIRVSGTLVPKNQLNSSAWEKYPIDGIIAVTRVEEM